jgi:hypothetical protein
MQAAQPFEARQVEIEAWEGAKASVEGSISITLTVVTRFASAAACSAATSSTATSSVAALAVRSAAAALTCASAASQDCCRVPLQQSGM